MISLKSFHLFFIAASAMLGALAGVWGVRLYLSSARLDGLVLGLVFLVSAAVLLVYRSHFLRKFGSLDE